MKALVYILLATLLIAQGAAYAQNTQPETAEQPWYQVEILIFAYQQATANNTELWPKELGLKYPERIVELKQATQNEVLLNSWHSSAEPIEVEQTEDPVLIEEPLTEEIASPDQLTEEESTTEQPSKTMAEILAEDTAEPITLPEPLLVTLKEQPFTLLPQEQLGFSEIKQKLLRQKDIRQLFHGAWRQAIGKRNDSESLLIRGGEQFDNHFELEGSISLGLERYLHITTDLWLSTFVSSAGRIENPWPVLPKPPLASSANGSLTKINKQNHNAVNPDKRNTSADIMLVNHQIMKNPFVDLTGRQYAVDQTATMRQSRRMRSNELHYIDHPLMGLLVRITPYELPEPAEEDTIEAEANQAQPASHSVTP